MLVHKFLLLIVFGTKRVSGFFQVQPPRCSTTYRQGTPSSLSSLSLDNLSSEDDYNGLNKDKGPQSVDNALRSDEEVGGEVKSDAPKIDDASAVYPPPADLISNLLRIASSCGRGEFASPYQRKEALACIDQLELQNPTLNPTTALSLIQGRWELVYSSTQLFRSSPFFMAGRAVCSTSEEAQQYDWFCDMHREALAISRIGAVRQVISETRMVSEFEVKAGAIPFVNVYSGGLPFTIDGAIVSSADIAPVNNGTAWELFMDMVEIKGSNLPGLRQALDNGLRLPSRRLGDLLKSTIDGYTNPKPVFETTYLDDCIRISRDQDGKVFVYGKLSNDTTPTDYSNIMPDLGVSKLLEGFNDAITKFYL